MKKQSITLHNWRCFEHLTFQMPSTSFVIADRNGTGKTSMLNAIYTLYTGKSWPNTLPYDHMKEGADFIGVRASKQWYWSGKKGPSGRMGYSYAKTKELPVLFTYSPTDNDWLGYTRVKKLSIADTLIATMEPSYGLHLQTLNQLVRQKQRLIKKKKRYSLSSDDTLAEIITKHILAQSAEVWRIRSQFWQILASSLPEFSDWIQVSLTDWSVPTWHSFWDGQRYPREELPPITWDSEAWQVLWRKECLLEKVLFGAQRDDFEIRVGNRSVEHTLSRGEMRLLVLFIKNVCRQHVLKPTWWLLDDVFNEFDGKRERILVQSILDTADKCIATSTKKNRFIPSYNIKELVA
jgi:recombinational DNA repair ATPase RecF